MTIGSGVIGSKCLNKIPEVLRKKLQKARRTQQDKTKKHERTHSYHRTPVAISLKSLKPRKWYCSCFPWSLSKSLVLCCFPFCHCEWIPKNIRWCPKSWFGVKGILPNKLWHWWIESWWSNGWNSLPKTNSESRFRPWKCMGFQLIGLSFSRGAPPFSGDMLVSGKVVDGMLFYNYNPKWRASNWRNSSQSVKDPSNGKAYYRRGWTSLWVMAVFVQVEKQWKTYLSDPWLIGA